MKKTIITVKLPTMRNNKLLKFAIPSIIGLLILIGGFLLVKKIIRGNDLGLNFKSETVTEDIINSTYLVKKTDKKIIAATFDSQEEYEEECAKYKTPLLVGETTMEDGSISEFTEVEILQLGIYNSKTEETDYIEVCAKGTLNEEGLVQSYTFNNDEDYESYDEYNKSNYYIDDNGNEYYPVMNMDNGYVFSEKLYRALKKNKYDLHKLNEYLTNNDKALFFDDILNVTNITNLLGGNVND